MVNLENKAHQRVMIYADKSSGNVPSIMYAKQYDVNSRYIVVSIMTVEGKYFVKGIAQLNAIKPDGTKVYIAGQTNADGTVTIGFTKQLLAVPGKVKCDITVFDEEYTDQILLTTSTFYINVEDTNYDEEAIESKDDYSEAFPALLKRKRVYTFDITNEDLVKIPSNISAFVDLATGVTHDYEFSVKLKMKNLDGDVITVPASYEYYSINKSKILFTNYVTDYELLFDDGEITLTKTPHNLVDVINGGNSNGF